MCKKNRKFSVKIIFIVYAAWAKRFQASEKLELKKSFFLIIIDACPKTPEIIY
jgi:hypothetical protein